MLRRFLVGTTLATVTVLGATAPAFAHDCFNPNKTNSNGSIGIVTITPEGEEFVPLKDHGGFVTIDASAVGAPDTINIHAFGGANGGPKDGVVGPQDRQPKLACDGKGIDLVEACLMP